MIREEQELLIASWSTLTSSIRTATWRSGSLTGARFGKHRTRKGSVKRVLKAARVRKRNIKDGRRAGLEE